MLETMALLRQTKIGEEFNAEDMRHICSKVGFIVKEQQIVDWGVKELDSEGSPRI